MTASYIAPTEVKGPLRRDMGKFGDSGRSGACLGGVVAETHCWRDPVVPYPRGIANALGLKQGSVSHCGA